MTRDGYPQDSQFPILVEYKDGRQVVVMDPKDLESGNPFRVLETRVDLE